MNIEDHAQLEQYLIDEGYIDRADRLRFATLTGGVSNRTVWVKRGQHPDWVVKQALAQLRVEVDWFSAPERINREAAALRWLEKVIPGYVPEFVFADAAHHVLAMTAIPQPHSNWKTLLLSGQTDLGFVRKFGKLLARIHDAAADFPELETDFADRRFFEELRLEPYYQYTAAQVPQAREFLERLIAETRQRRSALVHGDYSPKNVLIHNGKLIILDFEVMHFGDPAFDLGFSLTHFLSKAHFLREKRGEFLQMAGEYWRAYAGCRRENLAARQQKAVVNHTLACLLARVAGRSPLEYLGPARRERQLRMVVNLLEFDIGTVPALLQRFEAQLDSEYGQD